LFVFLLFVFLLFVFLLFVFLLFVFLLFVFLLFVFQLKNRVSIYSFFFGKALEQKKSSILFLALDQRKLYNTNCNSLC